MITEYKDIGLRDYNSFGVAVTARRLIEFETVEDLDTIFSTMLADDQEWRVLGGGNNILFVGDYEGTLIHPVANEIRVTAENSESVRVRVTAGVKWDDFIQWSVDRELWGLENLSKIPSTIGAAPVQNIGAYGVEASNVIESVEMYDVESGKQTMLAADHCGFGYRESVFKSSLKNRVIITAVNFKLSHTANPQLGYGDLQAEVEKRGGAILKNIRDAVAAIRAWKLPDPSEIGNGGSFFKNPVIDSSQADKLKAEYPDMPQYDVDDPKSKKISAAWMIDQAGWKGFREGDAGVHSRQALILVNYGNATGSEVLNLAGRIAEDVEKRFGVRIEPEINIWGSK